MSVLSERVSVVVLTWNSVRLIAGCLENLQSIDWPDLEIVVVDNGSRDGTVDYLRAQSDIKLILLPRNRGFAGGQVAARHALTGDFVALVNTDAVVDRDWLGVLMAEMREPTVAAAGGRAYEWNPSDPPGRIDVPYYSYQVIDTSTGAAITRTAGDEKVDVDSISGAAVLIRTSAMDAVGGFDHRFFAYYEETDLFARMIRAGHRIRYVPSGHAWHQVRASSERKPGFYEYYMMRNRALFFLRNFEEPERSTAWRRYLTDARGRLRHGGRPALVTVRALGSLSLLVPHIIQSRTQIRRLGDAYCAHLPGDPDWKASPAAAEGDAT